MEKHSNKLNDNDGEEEKHKNETDGLEMKIFCSYNHLHKKRLVFIPSTPELNF